MRWLERNGYDVSYFAGVDTDRRGAALRNHRVFMTAGHDAYWSAMQRQNIEAARDAGVHLAFLSSSTGFWRSRWEPSNDLAKTPHRTLVAYKETHADGKIDSVKDDWTGTWRDSRIFNPVGPKPENAVVGTLHTVGGFRNDPLMVPFDFAKLRFWRNTSVAGQKEGQTAVLGKGLLGYEWDQDIDNGLRPAGLVRLSATTIDNVSYLQDLGTIYDSGSATHHLTIYRASSGALVFSAATAQYRGDWTICTPTGRQAGRASGPRSPDLRKIFNRRRSIFSRTWAPNHGASRPIWPLPNRRRTARVPSPASSSRNHRRASPVPS